MLTLKELWSKEAFKDLELKNYVDIDDTPESHHCEKVEEKLLRLEEVLNLIGDYTKDPNRDPTYIIIEMINNEGLGFNLVCDYEDKDLRIIKKGSLSIELYPHLNPYVTYDTAIRMVMDYYYNTNVSMFKGISIPLYTDFDINEGDYGFEYRVLFDLITGVYFSSCRYKNYSSISEYASELLDFTVRYCKFEDTSFVKEDLPVKDLLKNARNSIARVIKKRHIAKITNDVLYILNEKYNAAKSIINAMFKSKCLTSIDTSILNKAETSVYIDSLDLLYKEYDLPEEYKFTSVYDRSTNAKQDLLRLFFALTENNRQIFEYIEKCKLDL
jgi:hypothetical protein